MSEQKKDYRECYWYNLNSKEGFNELVPLDSPLRGCSACVEHNLGEECPYYKELADKLASKK